MDEEEINEVDYLKNLDLQDFLNCDETRKVLQQEDDEYFEENIKYSLVNLFERYAKNYNCDIFLQTDPNGDKNSDIFSEIVGDNISKNFDLTIFYDNPYLAKKLF